MKRRRSRAALALWGALGMTAVGGCAAPTDDELQVDDGSLRGELVLYICPWSPTSSPTPASKSVAWRQGRRFA